MSELDRLHHFDRQGRPITLRRWAELTDDASYRRLLDDRLPNGRRVITIWNGITNPVQLFTTGVFAPAGEEKLGKMLHEEGWDTEAEALAGHDRLLKEWGAR